VIKQIGDDVRLATDGKNNLGNNSKESTISVNWRPGAGAVFAN
jgi:hypothetical protein